MDAEEAYERTPYGLLSAAWRLRVASFGQTDDLRAKLLRLSAEYAERGRRPSAVENAGAPLARALGPIGETARAGADG